MAVAAWIVRAVVSFRFESESDSRRLISPFYASLFLLGGRKDGKGCEEPSPSFDKCLASTHLRVKCVPRDDILSLD